MKFRLPRKIKYLRKARHWRGHGIHSPFLFYLVTKVIENKKPLPAYKILRSQKKHIIYRLKEIENQAEPVNSGLSLQRTFGKKKFYKNIELGYRYGKLLLRLINEFKPSSVSFYGPTLGMNLLYLALADAKIPVNVNPADALLPDLCQEVLERVGANNIRFLHKEDAGSLEQEFVFINFPFFPEQTNEIIRQKLKQIGSDDVMIIRGIHRSAEMETLWKDLIKEKEIRVSLDLYEIGILLFRKKLQKQHFVLRY